MGLSCNSSSYSAIAQIKGLWGKEQIWPDTANKADKNSEILTNIFTDQLGSTEWVVLGCFDTRSNDSIFCVLGPMCAIILNKTRNAFHLDFIFSFIP